MEQKTQQALEALSVLYEYAKIGMPVWEKLEQLNVIYIMLKDAVNERMSFRRTITMLADENEKQREIYLRRIRKKEQKINELEEALKNGQAHL